jgi:bla regulator protein BlaR1
MNALDSLFEWVLAATLRASALAALVLGIQFALRRQLPATWRHALWLPMLLVLILPMLPKIPLGILPARQAVAPRVIEASAVTSALPRAEKEVAVAAAKPAAIPVTGYLAVAWLSGTCLMLGAGIAGYRRSLNRVRKDACPPDAELARTLEETARESGLREIPRVLLSPAVESPAVTGLFRPVLLLPEGFPRGFSDAEARLILLHEFTHVKRLDLPVNWLTCVLQSMHWFNPLLWFAFARMRADREAACDAQVLSLGTTDRRSDYGHALLKLQLAAPTAGLSLGFVGIFERSANLRSRLQDISMHRRAHPLWRPAGVTLIGILTLGGATEAQERAPRREQDRAPIAAAKDPHQLALEKKLDKIVLPAISFNDTSLEEAIDFLRLRSKELDTTTEVAALKGVNLVVRRAKTEPGRLTMELRNVTLRKAIENVAEAAGLTMTVSQFSVALLPREDAGASKLAQSKAMKAAEKIIIPELDLPDASLREAIDLLNRQAKQLAAEGKAPTLEPGDEEIGKARITELHLRNLPLSEVVKYVAEMTKATLSADDEVIRFGK